MMKLIWLLALCPGAILAQSLEGVWQGVLIPPNQGREIRLAFKITKDGNAYQGMFYNLEANRQLNLGAITLQGTVEHTPHEALSQTEPVPRPRDVEALQFYW